MKSPILFLCCCFIFIQNICAQNATSYSLPNASTATIKGKITTEKGLPVPYVTVGLENAGKSVLTNAEGEYLLSGLEPGKMLLVVAGVGIITQKKNITLSVAQILTVNLIVNDTLRRLKEVTIKYSKNKFSANAGDGVARMPLPDLENPQSYTVISKDLIQEQMSVSYNDAFKNIAGSEIPSVANNGRVDISSRGFKVRSQIVDGVSGYTMTTIDPADIEKIEVIKGPSATLFGSSLTSYGGLVNIITKQPYDHRGANVSYTLGSFGLNRLTADINTPLNKKQTLLFRINGAGQTEKSYQDAGFAKSIFAAPTLSYRVNDRFFLMADVEFYGRKATSPFWFVPYKKTTINNVLNLPINDDLSFSNNDIYYNAHQLNFRLRAYGKISNGWKSQTILSNTANQLNGSMLSLVGVSDSTLTRSISSGPQYFSTTEIQQNFLNSLIIGKIKNTLLIGLDYYHYKTTASIANIKADTVNFIHPGEGYLNFNHSLVNDRLSDATYHHTSASQNTYSAYISDVITLNKRWSAMLSLRLDHFENGGTTDNVTGKTSGKYGQTALSPKFGIVYQVMPEKLSLFANYMNGFENVNGTGYYGNSFKPQRANQLEGGVKMEMFNGKLTGTMSYYHILVDNILRDDRDHINYSVQDGTELSRGVEIETMANPLSGLNIVAGYAYNFCIYQKANDNLTGRRPDGAGPQNTAHLWLSYVLKQGKVEGLGLGLGGIYGSSLQTIKSFTPIFIVPGYTVAGATIFYKHTFYRIGLKIDNLTNKRYWNNRLQLQPPRSFLANLTLEF